jgi:hypothetical protein
MDTTNSTRTIDRVCSACSLSMDFCLGQARCINDKCPLYWKGQGGIETLRPVDGYIPTGPPTQTSVILKPQEL